MRRGGCELREYLCELGKLKGGCGCSGEVWVFVECPTQTNETADWATKSGTLIAPIDFRLKVREACGLSSHEAKSESPVHLLYSPREQVASLLHVRRPSQTDSYHHKHHKQRQRQLFPWWHSFSWTRRGSIGSHSTVCISKDATVCPGEAIKCGHSNPTTSGGPVEASCRWHQPPLSFLIPRDGELGQSPNARAICRIGNTRLHSAHVSVRPSILHHPHVLLHQSTSSKSLGRESSRFGRCGQNNQTNRWNRRAGDGGGAAAAVRRKRSRVGQLSSCCLSESRRPPPRLG